MKLFILSFFACTILLSGCTATYDAGAANILNVGINPELKEKYAAKVTLLNNTTQTLYFRIIDLTNGQALTDDIQLNSGQSRVINPSSNRPYMYMIFRSGQDDIPAYKCESAYFKAGYSYKLDYEAAISGK